MRSLDNHSKGNTMKNWIAYTCLTLAALIGVGIVFVDIDHRVKEDRQKETRQTQLEMDISISNYKMGLLRAERIMLDAVVAGQLPCAKEYAMHSDLRVDSLVIEFTKEIRKTYQEKMK